MDGRTQFWTLIKMAGHRESWYSDWYNTEAEHTADLKSLFPRAEITHEDRRPYDNASWAAQRVAVVSLGKKITV